MIGALRGVLLERGLEGYVVVDVGGVGYQVYVTASTLGTLGEVGAEIYLSIHTRVREDAITLYGFQNTQEKVCFEALIGAHGVGPSMAMSLLEMHSPAALRHIVAADDIDALSKVPGIGKKTATRLLIELKSKLDVQDSDQIVRLISTTPEKSSARADVSIALGELGYTSEEIRHALALIPADGQPEQLLRMALRELTAVS